MEELTDPSLTVKILANQWYWTFEYGNLNLNWDSYMVPETELLKGEHRLLTADKPLFLPVESDIRLIITSKDVIHSFASPSLGLKVDAVPGRLNQLSTFINRTGVFYGQCSESCGVNHAFMPIQIIGISPADFLNLPHYNLTKLVSIYANLDPITLGSFFRDLAQSKNEAAMLEADKLLGLGLDTLINIKYPVNTAWLNKIATVNLLVEVLTNVNGTISYSAHEQHSGLITGLILGLNPPTPTNVAKLMIQESLDGCQAMYPNPIPYMQREDVMSGFPAHIRPYTDYVTVIRRPSTFHHAITGNIIYPRTDHTVPTMVAKILALMLEHYDNTIYRSANLLTFITNHYKPVSWATIDSINGFIAEMNDLKVLDLKDLTPGSKTVLKLPIHLKNMFDFFNIIKPNAFIENPTMSLTIDQYFCGHLQNFNYTQYIPDFLRLDGLHHTMIKYEKSMDLANAPEFCGAYVRLMDSAVDTKCYCFPNI